uniref:Shikimate O-hydroxycinnamoyltransferase n=1 Tax=Medicago truncatula TaxID=3880 RepID=B7FK12_MEDTR|nr:unknown [Medicago truncatula]
MSSIQVLSTTPVHAPNHNPCDPNYHHTIDLTPWDLQFLPFGVNQKGLIYHHPSNLDTSNQIEHLKHSLSSTLEFFPPFTGRLKIKEHEDNTISCSITCNNVGALFVHAVSMKVGDLLQDNGLGKGALEMNKMIALQSDEMLKNEYESWLKTPSFITDAKFNCKTLVGSSSPWFDVYGNDFGWGKPVGVRTGGANKENGNICVFQGVEKDSMDLEVCLSHETLEAIGNDPEFMNVASN